MITIINFAQYYWVYTTILLNKPVYIIQYRHTGTEESRCDKGMVPSCVAPYHAIGHLTRFSSKRILIGWHCDVTIGEAMPTWYHELTGLVTFSVLMINFILALCILRGHIKHSWLCLATDALRAESATRIFCCFHWLIPIIASQFSGSITMQFQKHVPV